MKVAGWMWAVWAAVPLVTFAVLEFIAMTNGIPGDTLTATIRRDVPYALFFVAFGAFVFWFATHMRKAFHHDDEDMHLPPRG
jgi:hypothetical protein